MGYYTELMLAIELKPDTPIYVLTTLDWFANRFSNEKMDGQYENMIVSLNSHPFFKCKRWDAIGTNMTSALFTGANTTFTPKTDYQEWAFSTRSYFKNYDQEAQLFVDWIAPWARTNGLVGWIREEGYRQEPTMILFCDGAYEFSKVSVEEQYEQMLDRRDKMTMEE